MSTTIESVYGSKWTISNSSIDDDGPQVAIDSRSSAGNRVFLVADVLNAMRAEGVLDAVEIITELPEVEESPSAVSAYVGGQAFGIDGHWADGTAHRKQALRSLALARFCEARFAAKVDERKAAKAVLAERRDALAAEIGGHRHYEELFVTLRTAINHIIELEDQLAAK